MWSSGDDDVLDTIENEDEYTPQAKRCKSKKQTWTEKNMAEAASCCKNQELGIEEASLIYGVPKRSLRSRLKEKNFSVIDDKYRVFVLPVFPVQAETELVGYLEEAIKGQFSFTSVEIRRLGYELISEKYRLNNLPMEKDCLLGNRWYRDFMERYPHLETENLVKDPTERFYDALEMLIDGVESGRIYAVDGVELKFRASNAYDFDKIYHRRKIIYTDAKAVCCISAAGEFVPPVFIRPKEREEVINQSIGDDVVSEFRTAHDKLKDWCDNDTRLLPTAEEVANIRNQIKSHLNRKVESASEENEEELREKLYEQFNRLRNKIVSKYENSLNAISSDVFHEWFRKFVEVVRATCQQRTILLLGEQNFAKSLKTLEMARGNGISLLVLPPHSSHKIYPLDGFTMSLNRNLSTCASVWLGKNPDFKIQEVPLQELFKTAYERTMNESIAKNGFVYSGIWPVNRRIFQSSELGGESILMKKSSPGYEGCSNRSTSGMEETIELSKLCRVCMKEKMYMKPLFESGEANYHGRKISEIINRSISPEDGLPRRICQYCLVQLMDMLKIRNVAAESHKKLSEKMNRFYFHGEVSGLDPNSICRICLGEKPLMSSIFYASGSRHSADLSCKIAEVSNCEVRPDDGMSSSICAFCRTSVNQAWDFIRKVTGSDERFRELLSGANLIR